MNKKLQEVLSFVGKKLKAESAPRPMSQFPQLSVEVVTTGSIILDRALGRGGWPRGHFVELIGNEGVGKTTLCYHAIAEFQKQGLLCALIDAEHRADPEYAKALGVNLDDLIFLQPMKGEDAWEAIRQYAKSGKVDLVILDSIDAARPEVEGENDFDSSNIGRHAKLTGNGMRQASILRGIGNMCCIFTNQIRQNPAAMGDPNVTPGGNAAKFYCSIRVSLKRKGTNKDKAEQSVSNTVQLKTSKNSIAPPYKEGEFDLVFGKGIDKLADALNAGVAAGIITKKGSFYSFTYAEKNVKLGQGEDAAKLWLSQGERLEKITSLIRKSQWFLEGIGDFKPREQAVSQEDSEEQSGEDAEVLQDGGGSQEGSSTNDVRSMREYFLSMQPRPASPEGEDGDETL